VRIGGARAGRGEGISVGTPGCLRIRPITGARSNSETLEVTLRGKTIDDILNRSVEEGMTFFAAEPAIGKKIEVLNDLGLGYLTLGQSATTLSGGEAAAC